MKRRPLAVGSGPDPPSSKTVEGRRIAAMKAAETRALNRMARETKETEEAEHGPMARIFKFIGWLFSYMKFRVMPNGIKRMQRGKGLGLTPPDGKKESY